MSDSITTARPYAKAIFEQALAEKKLANWSRYLSVLAYVASSNEGADFIANPNATTSQRIELLQAICHVDAEPSTVGNLIHLLADNKRLALLPEIYMLYEEFKAEQEKTLDVEVISFSPVSAEQQQQMITSLSQRLQRKVSLNISLDPSLLGGAVIRAGDLVIDGSVRGKLNKLSTDLAA